ncbi:DUF5004 domain-containing protein [Salinimicrobium catena]|uniref:DUF5004 domain-containing protein n=1 Tax=Salinimicrobium catena TaxID=390640 RepID=UPI002FE4C7FB
MKKINFRILTLLLAVLIFGCNTPDDGNYVEPITTYEVISGEWSLMNLTMVDEVAKVNNIKPNEENLSTQFNFEDFRIRFDVDENNKPTTYVVLGDVPPLFQLSGFWDLNADFQPTNSGAIVIRLYSDEAKTQLKDELYLTSVPRTNRQMELQIIRRSGGTPFVSYKFKLIEEI